jgi:hypothetical protein
MVIKMTGRENEFDSFYEYPCLRDAPRDECRECERCSDEKRKHCKVPKRFIERYGFNNYKEMIDCESSL